MQRSVLANPKQGRTVSLKTKRNNLSKKTVPKEILALAEKNPSFRKTMKGCFNFREHLTDAIRNSIFLKERIPKKLRHAFVLAVVLHDAGKMRAVGEGKKELQQKYTVDILKRSRIFEQLGANANERKLILALVGVDSIGEFLQQKTTLAQASEKIKFFAKTSGTTTKTFIQLLELLYIADVGAHESLRGMLLTKDWQIANPKYLELKQSVMGK
jgi:hypothetical protein